METNIYEKLSLIQNELKAPKNQYNKFGNFYYRNCEDIMEAVKPICKKNRTTLTVHDEVELIGDRYYIKAVATLHDWDNGNGEIKVTALARESVTKKGMDDSQVTGATSSYARKYALNGLFNIDDTKDVDTDAFKNQQAGDKKKQSENKTAPKQSKNDKSRNNQTSILEEKQNKIWYFYGEHKETFGPVLKGMLQGRNLRELPEQELDELLEIIETSQHTFGGN